MRKLRKTGGGWEGEAPAEPHGARNCWGDGSPGGSPSQFFHSFPSKGNNAAGMDGPENPPIKSADVNPQVVHGLSGLLPHLDSIKEI
ncbi:MAG: hypothetical protein DMG06_02930 [Acidobacteria bacterium]|nr:MAG: hypothetical protein DMG06_02930 [Acidobacteriota bacterium]